MASTPVVRTSSTASAVPLTPTSSTEESNYPGPPGFVRGTSVIILEEPGSGAQAHHDHLRTVTEGFVSISLSPSQEANLYGLPQDTSPDPNTYVAEYERVAIVDTPPNWDSSSKANGEEKDSLWDDFDGAHRGKQPDAILCPAHGVICKKGICQEYSKILREKEKKEREANKRDARNDGNAGAKGKSASFFASLVARNTLIQYLSIALRRVGQKQRQQPRSQGQQ